MLLGGDEFRRTQRGNNNAYCQDNETSWYDWSCLDKNREIFRFARGMIAFRRAHPILSKEQFYTDAEIHWFGSQGGLPNWTDPKEKRFGCLIHEDEPERTLPDVQCRRRCDRFRFALGTARGSLASGR